MSAGLCGVRGLSGVAVLAETSRRGRRERVCRDFRSRETRGYLATVGCARTTTRSTSGARQRPTRWRRVAAPAIALVHDRLGRHRRTRGVGRPPTPGSRPGLPPHGIRRVEPICAHLPTADTKTVSDTSHSPRQADEHSPTRSGKYRRRSKWQMQCLAPDENVRRVTRWIPAGRPARTAKLNRDPSKRRAVLRMPPPPTGRRESGRQDPTHRKRTG